MEKDLKTSRLNPDQAYDREKWRIQSRRADPATDRCKVLRRRGRLFSRKPDECTLLIEM